MTPIEAYKNFLKAFEKRDNDKNYLEYKTQPCDIVIFDEAFCLATYFRDNNITHMTVKTKVKTEDNGWSDRYCSVHYIVVDFP